MKCGRNGLNQMDYTNSITTRVQQQIDMIFAEKIEEADSVLEMYETAVEIREFLTDRKNISTPGFLMRRYLQVHSPELFGEYECGRDYPDLTAEQNVPWPECVTDRIAKKLSSISRSVHGLTISTANWKKYLNDEQGVQRLLAIKLSFVLNMDRNASGMLLLACGHDLYSVRNPQDFICLYCLERPDRRIWSYAETLLSRFAESAGDFQKQTKAAFSAHEGMTEMLGTGLEEILFSELPSHDADERLIAFMTGIRDEFTALRGGKYVAGFSLTRRSRFMDLTRYLAVLYPEYASWEHELISFEKLPTDEDGYPNLKCLVRAMFQENEWEFEAWQSEDPGEEQNELFQKEIYIFCKNYYEHVNAVDRMIRRGDNMQPVERRDILLMGYFFLVKFLELSPSSEKMAELRKLADGGNELDDAMADIMDWLTDASDTDDDGGIMYYRRCLNTLLAAFDFMPLYVPFSFDRFILLSLLTTNPEELVPFIICENRQMICGDLAEEE